MTGFVDRLRAGLSVRYPGDRHARMLNQWVLIHAELEVQTEESDEMRNKRIASECHVGKETVRRHAKHANQLCLACQEPERWREMWAQVL